LKKKSLYRILIALFLLACFTSGQVITWGHAHFSDNSAQTTKKQGNTASSSAEKCQICQTVQHGDSPVPSLQLFSDATVSVLRWVDIPALYPFTRVIQGSDRAPPASAC
jgi:hypothetical protein